MKNLLLSTLLMFIASIVSAQSNIPKFLGFPIDGSKQEMIMNLKSRGFVYNQFDDFLTGEFNGEDVEIRILTDNNRVWRIAVFDRTFRNENQIKLRYNKLYRQFYNNGKYLAYSHAMIPDDEDISIELLDDDKSYEATFIQIPGMTDVHSDIRERYTPREFDELPIKLSDNENIPENCKPILDNFERTLVQLLKNCQDKMKESADSLVFNNCLNYSDLIKIDYNSFEEEYMTPTMSAAMELEKKLSFLTDDELDKISTILAEKAMAFSSQQNTQTAGPLVDDDVLKNNSVWYKIDNSGYGKYRILMFYDNERNRAHGEDL